MAALEIANAIHAAMRVAVVDGVAVVVSSVGIDVARVVRVGPGDVVVFFEQPIGAEEVAYFVTPNSGTLPRVPTVDDLLLPEPPTAVEGCRVRTFDLAGIQVDSSFFLQVLALPSVQD